MAYHGLGEDPPDFFALGRKAREFGFVVRLKSNGHALREPLARRIQAEIDPYEIELSLHRACAATHDRPVSPAASCASWTIWRCYADSECAFGSMPRSPHGMKVRLPICFA